MKRYVLEANWHGYRSSQDHAVHREVISPKKAEMMRDLVGVRFTDGTTMYVTVREAKYREKVSPIIGYREVLDSCYYNKRKGVVNVMEV